MAGIPVFMSFPTPHMEAQARFVDDVSAYLSGRGLDPRTVGVSDYDMDSPLAGIRRLMIQSCGLLTIAFGRSYAPTLHIRYESDRPAAQYARENEVWLTSPWSHIEPAMAYQLGLPIVVVREKGVRAEGMLERGVSGLYLPEVDLKAHDTLKRNPELLALLNQWEGRVRTVYQKRGQPPTYF